jgi:hypothetical protein
MDNINYLKVTMHDNDFTSYYQILGNTIKDILYFGNFYPYHNFENHSYFEGKAFTESDLEALSVYIDNLWYSIHNAATCIGNIDAVRKIPNTPMSNFKCTLSVVPAIEVLNLPKSGSNGEDLYIPLFSKDAEILLY